MVEYIKENYIMDVPFGNVEFGFYQEWVMFFGLIILMITSLIFAIGGYKYFQASIFMFFACGFGYLGYLIGGTFTDSPVFMMVFLISFVFFGLMIIFLLGSGIFTASNKGNFKNSIMKKMYLISSLLGALSLACLVYFFVLRDYYISAGLFLIVFIIGFMHQKKNKDRQISFKTYDDIYFKDTNRNAD